jgi:hypothetical protein
MSTQPPDFDKSDLMSRFKLIFTWRKVIALALLVILLWVVACHADISIMPAVPVTPLLTPRQQTAVGAVATTSATNPPAVFQLFWTVTNLVAVQTSTSADSGWQDWGVWSTNSVAFTNDLSPHRYFRLVETNAANVTLSWTQSPSQLVAGTKIVWGILPGVYTATNDAGTNLTLTVSNLNCGTTYDFAAFNYSAAGAVSALSSNLSYTVPVPTNSIPKLTIKKI